MNPGQVKLKSGTCSYKLQKERRTVRVYTTVYSCAYGDAGADKSVLPVI